MGDARGQFMIIDAVRNDPPVIRYTLTRHDSNQCLLSEVRLSFST